MRATLQKRSSFITFALQIPGIKANDMKLQNVTLSISKLVLKHIDRLLLTVASTNLAILTVTILPRVYK